jgi:hypothetical protein
MGKQSTFVPAKAPVPDVLGAIFADTGRPVQVAISQISTDGGTQMRAGLDDATVFEYTQSMIAAQGWGTFPAVVAYHDGAAYWLADGFHRVAAFRDAFPDGSKTIPVEVRAGTRRDAVLHAAGANAQHGLRRTNQDKRRAVETLLRDEEWAAWSDGTIAKACAVSDRFVSGVRKDLTPNGSESAIRKGADGRTINTANIGTSRSVERRLAIQRETRPAPQVEPAKPVYTPVAIAGTGEPQSGTPIPPRGAVLNTPPAEIKPVDPYTPDDLRAAGWSISYRREYGIDKYRSIHTDPKRHLWGYRTTAEEMISEMRRVEALHAAAEPAPISLDELEVVDSVTVETTSGMEYLRNPFDGPDDLHPLDCYEENGAPAAGRMRDLWELKDWFRRTKEQKLREYQKLTGHEVPVAMAVSLDYMIQRLEEAMTAFQAEVEAGNVNH